MSAETVSLRGGKERHSAEFRRDVGLTQALHRPAADFVFVAY